MVSASQVPYVPVPNYYYCFCSLHEFHSVIRFSRKPNLYIVVLYTNITKYSVGDLERSPIIRISSAASRDSIF